MLLIACGLSICMETAHSVVIYSQFDYLLRMESVFGMALMPFPL